MDDPKLISNSTDDGLFTNHPLYHTEIMIDTYHEPRQVHNDAMKKGQKV